MQGLTKGLISIWLVKTEKKIRNRKREKMERKKNIFIRELATTLKSHKISLNGILITTIISLFNSL